MVISLRRDPKTGKQNILVRRERHEPPFEPVELRARLIEKIFGKGFDAVDAGELIVEIDNGDA
ncbi:MAG: hypothetical protein JWO38_6801 [Gemmataceae bacterium]|nr:hypothetical protein [Gemmataceae bacterium]